MRVDMYLLPEATTADDAELRLACQLTGKAWPAHRQISICCAAAQQARLDDLLWQQPVDRFIAHGISDTAAAVQAPVQISDRPLAGSLLIQLCEQLPSELSAQQYQRILDVIGAGEQQRQAGRLRYRQYQQLGADLHTHHL